MPEYGATGVPLEERTYTHNQYLRYPNTGVLWRNKSKKDGDAKGHDYKGPATVNGLKYWMFGKLDCTHDGEMYLKIYFRRAKDAETSRA